MTGLTSDPHEFPGYAANALYIESGELALKQAGAAALIHTAFRQLGEEIEPEHALEIVIDNTDASDYVALDDDDDEQRRAEWIMECHEQGFALLAAQRRAERKKQTAFIQQRLAARRAQRFEAA